MGLMCAFEGVPKLLCRHILTWDGFIVRGFLGVFWERGILTIKGVCDLDDGVWALELRPFGSP